jgi:hypothetical protein
MAEEILEQINEFSPQTLKIHGVAAEAPDECHHLLDHAFVSPHFCLYFNIPSYLSWLQARTAGEREAVYRYYRTQIQYLQRYARGKRWVSKTFVHQYFLSTLLKEFPDAHIVRLHREPGAAISSLCSLLANYRSIYTSKVDLRQLGRTVFDITLRGASEVVQTAHSENRQAQFCDLFFEEISRDPLAAVRKIYAAFGYEFHGDFAERVEKHLAANPRNKKGVHQHSLADFGLSQKEVDTAFEPYNRWLRSIRAATEI